MGKHLSKSQKHSIVVLFAIQYTFTSINRLQINQFIKSSYLLSISICHFSRWDRSQTKIQSVSGNRLSLRDCKAVTALTQVVGSMETPSKAFLLFFLLPDWLKLNHLKSRMECGFSDTFSRHICSSVAETIRVTNYAASFGAKKCSENHI